MWDFYLYKNTSEKKGLCIWENVVSCLLELFINGIKGCNTIDLFSAKSELYLY